MAGGEIISGGEKLWRGINNVENGEIMAKISIMAAAWRQRINGGVKEKQQRHRGGEMASGVIMSNISVTWPSKAIIAEA